MSGFRSLLWRASCSAARTSCVRAVHARPTAVPARFFASKVPDPDLESDLDLDNQEIGLQDINKHAKESLVDDVDTILNLENPPDLPLEAYQKLRGIDFKGRDNMLRDVSLANKEHWDSQLESLQEGLESQFKFSEDEEARIAAIDQDWQDSADQLQMELGVKPTETTEFRGLPGHEDDDMMNEVLEANISSNPALMYEDLDFSSEFLPMNKRKTQCIFCLGDDSRRKVKTIEYTNIQLLVRYINERGMIKPRDRTHTCATHQRKIKTAVKRARFMGLLNYTSNFYVPQSFAMDEVHGSSKLESSSGFKSFKDAFEIEQTFSDEDEPVDELFVDVDNIPDTVEIDGTDMTEEQNEFRQKEREKHKLSKERAKLKKKEQKVKKEDQFSELLGLAADDLRDTRKRAQTESDVDPVRS